MTLDKLLIFLSLNVFICKMKIIIVSNSTVWLRELIEMVSVKCLAQYLTQCQHSNDHYDLCVIIIITKPPADLMRSPSANHVNSGQCMENCKLSNSTVGWIFWDVSAADSVPGHMITICGPFLPTVRASWFEPSQNVRRNWKSHSLFWCTPLHPWIFFHQNIMLCMSLTCKVNHLGTVAV